MQTRNDRPAAEPLPANPRRRRVPLLIDVRIAAPCDASWDEMSGDERVRFCDHCEKNVYNLSSMARDEAEQLLAEREGSICVRVYQRADGMILTTDCPDGVRLRRRKRVAAGVAAFGLAATAAAMLMPGERHLGEVMTQSVEIVETPTAATAATVETSGAPLGPRPMMGDMPVAPSGQPVQPPESPDPAQRLPCGLGPRPEFRPTAGVMRPRPIPPPQTPPKVSPRRGPRTGAL